MIRQIFSFQFYYASLRRALHSPFGVQAFVLSLAVFFLMSFHPPYLFWTAVPFGEEFGKETEMLSFREPGFLDNTAGAGPLYPPKIERDAQGNIIKRAHISDRDKTVTYIVKSGDNLHKIAEKFGLDISTILWANNLTTKEVISPRQELKIPPTDGIYYLVEKGDTLSEISKVYGISIDEIYRFNRMREGDSIRAGQEIFLPGAQKILVQKKTTSPKGQTASGKMPAPGLISTGVTEIASIGYKLLRPTTGLISQGVRPGHTALDISNKLNTPVLSAANGTVILAENGWNYGYGNYVIVDHGDGVQTLYAHLNEITTSIGSTVSAGQQIGLMGNSGRVFGKTGVHLHFEVRINGRKANPNNYF